MQQTGLPPEDREKKVKVFEGKGLADKLNVLKTECEVFVEHEDCLTTINQIRHCLTHRRGVVGRKDCKDGKVLSVRWFWFEVWAEKENGGRVALDLPISKPVFVEKSRVALAMKEKRKDFPLDSVVSFSAQEIAEICDFVHTKAEEFKAAAVEYGRKNGATILDESSQGTCEDE